MRWTEKVFWYITCIEHILERREESIPGSGIGVYTTTLTGAGSVIDFY